MSMNTRLSGSARVDDIKGHLQGEIRGQTKVVNITEDAEKYAAEQKIAETDTLGLGSKEEVKEFADKGAEAYAKA